MVLCCCNWGITYKLMYIWIHDYAFFGLQFISIISAIASLNIASSIINILYLVCVNIPRLIFAIQLMRSKYSLYQAERNFKMKVVTIIFQIIYILALVIILIVLVAISFSIDVVTTIPVGIIVMIIIIAFDIYYTTIIRGYYTNPQLYTQNVQNNSNAAQQVNSNAQPDQLANNVTYIQYNQTNQSKIPYKKESEYKAEHDKEADA